MIVSNWKTIVDDNNKNFYIKFNKSNIIQTNSFEKIINPICSEDKSSIPYNVNNIPNDLDILHTERNIIVDLLNNQYNNTYILKKFNELLEYEKNFIYTIKTYKFYCKYDFCEFGINCLHKYENNLCKKDHFPHNKLYSDLSLYINYLINNKNINNLIKWEKTIYFVISKMFDELFELKVYKTNDDLNFYNRN